MSKRTNLRLLFAVAFVFGFAGASPADEFIIVNGLPCGTFCRAWMGIKLPPPHEAPASVEQSEAPPADAEPANRRHEPHKALKPKMARHKLERRETEVAERKPDSRAERRAERSVGARGARSPTDLTSAGAVLASPIPEPPKAPAASPAPTPEVSVAAPEAKSQPEVESATPSPAATPEVSVASPEAKPAVDSADHTGAVAIAPTPSPGPTASPEATLSAQQAGAGPAAQSAAPPATPETAVAVAPDSGKAVQPSPAASAAALANQSADQRDGSGKAREPAPSPSATPTPAESETTARSADADVKQPAQASATPTLAPSTSPSAEPAPAAPEGANRAAVADKAPATAPSAPEVATLGDAGKPNDPAAAPERKDTTASPGAPAPPQMLVVLAKPEVKTAADLNDKTVLIAGVTSVSGEQLKASFAVAGAGQAQFKQGDKSDIDELPRGDVAAAVVAVATPGVAADFQEIPGFHVLYLEVLPYVGR